MINYYLPIGRSQGWSLWDSSWNTKDESWHNWRMFVNGLGMKTLCHRHPILKRWRVICGSVALECRGVSVAGTGAIDLGDRYSEWCGWMRSGAASSCARSLFHCFTAKIRLLLVPAERARRLNSYADDGLPGGAGGQVAGVTGGRLGRESFIGGKSRAAASHWSTWDNRCKWGVELWVVPNGEKNRRVEGTVKTWNT